MTFFTINRMRWGIPAFGRVAFLLLLGSINVFGTASCRLVWNANTEPELAGYMVYYGTASRQYTQTLDVGLATNTPIYNLAEGITYYFVVTAYDAARLESEPSVEVSYLVPVSALTTWQRQYFTLVETADTTIETTYWGETADPDGDGRINIMEYALGLSPLDGNDGHQGVSADVRDDGHGHFQYVSFMKRKNDPQLVYEPLVSGNKQNWQTGSQALEAAAVQNFNAEFDLATYRDLTPVEPGQPRFFQLKVSRNGQAIGCSEIYVTTATSLKGNAGSGSRLTYFSLSMVQPWVACGTITALGANTLTDDRAEWSEDQFNGINGDFYLEFSSGLTVDIEDTDARTQSVTLPGDLRPVLAVGDSYRIRKHYTVADVFGANNEAGLMAGSKASLADNVILLDAATQKTLVYFYYNASSSGLKDRRELRGTKVKSLSSYGPGAGWYGEDFRPAGTSVVYPEQGIIVSRKVAGDLAIYMSGMMKAGSTWVPISQGVNLVGTMKALKNLKLNELNLVTGNPVTGLAGGNTPSAADNVFIPNGNSLTLYFYCDVAGYEGWYDGAFRPVNTVEIPAGSAFYIKRKAPYGTFDWVITGE